VHGDEDSFVLRRVPIRVNEELASTRVLHVPTEIVRGAPRCTACNPRRRAKRVHCPRQGQGKLGRRHLLCCEVGRSARTWAAPKVLHAQKSPNCPGPPTVYRRLVRRSPQSVPTLTYDGQVLPAKYGFPMKLWIPTKLGYKNPKHIAAITVTNTYPGGYWENQVSEARSRTHYIS
jgi:hypothetical protein